MKKLGSLTKSARGYLGGLARAARMSPEQRSECARKAANTRWGSSAPRPQPSTAFYIFPCFVYVKGLRGPEPQIWYEPMVDAHGNAQGSLHLIVGKPVQLPPRVGGRPPWTPEEAHRTATVLAAME